MEGTSVSLCLCVAHIIYIFFVSLTFLCTYIRCFLSLSSVPNSVLSLLNYLILSSQWDHEGGTITIPNTNTKARRAEISWPRSPSWCVAEPGCKPSLSVSVALALLLYPMWIREGEPIRQEKGRRKPTMTGALCLQLFLSSLRGISSLSISLPCGWACWTISRAVWTLSYSAKRLFPFPRKFKNNLPLWGEKGPVEFLFRIQFW